MSARRSPRAPGPSGFRWLWNVLVVHSVKDLLRYKSFLLLVGVLIAADRAFQTYLRPQETRLRLPPLSDLGPAWAAWIFDSAPGALLDIALDGRALAALLGLFCLKELISL
jgi:hypothetical protein